MYTHTTRKCWSPPERCPRCELFVDPPEDQVDGVAERCGFCSFPLAPLEGRFGISHRFAEGGFGALFLAQDLATPGSFAVVKVLKEELATCPGTRELFCREIAHTSVMSSHDERVVRILSHGEAQGLGVYYVMEYLEGITLADELEQGGLKDWHSFFEVFSQLFGVIDHLHRYGIIHGDLKPENIMLCSRSGGIQLKLLDFGISTGIGVERTGMLREQSFGTPYYMAPEQCLMGALDSRTEVYSLGVILYETLAGVRPLGREGEEDPLSVMSEQLNTIPQPISKRCPGLMLPVSMECAIIKALEKEPSERFGSVAAFWDAFSWEKPLCVGERPQAGRQTWSLSWEHGGHQPLEGRTQVSADELLWISHPSLSLDIPTQEFSFDSWKAA